jgi:predicted Zn finger-like uncharacterized protein
VVLTCPSCQTRYRLEERHFAGRDRFQFKCPHCGQSIEALREPPASPEAAPASGTRAQRADSTWTESGMPEGEPLSLPEGKRVSIAVLQGKDAGAVIPVEKPLVVIGRSEADVLLDDSEVSRRHAQVEFRGQSTYLRDLKSTNGTYVNEQRITVAPIDDRTEFRVGATTLMLIVTDEIV